MTVAAEEARHARRTACRSHWRQRSEGTPSTCAADGFETTWSERGRGLRGDEGWERKDVRGRCEGEEEGFLDTHFALGPPSSHSPSLM